MTIIQNDRRPRNDNARAEVTRGDIRTLAQMARNQHVNSTHIQPVVRAQEAGTTSDPNAALLDTAQTFTAAQSITVTDAATNTQTTVLTLSHRSTGTPAVTFGANLLVRLDTDTNTEQTALAVVTTWATATDASRKARIRFFAYDTASREAIRIEASGTAAMLSFYGVAAVVRPAALTAANAGTVNSGDATTDTVINNMRVRIGELEAKLQSLGLLS